MTRIILFLLKCLVGLLATVGFLLVAAVVAAALLIPRFEGLMPQLAAVPEQAVLVLDLSEGLIERRPDSPLARASLGGTLEIGRAHVCTPFNNAHLVCRSLLEKK